MPVPDNIVHLSARTDGRLIKSEARQAAATGLHHPGQISSPHHLTGQRHCPAPRTGLWYRVRMAIGLMRTAIASFLTIQTAPATPRTGGHQEDPKSPDLHHFGEHVQGDAMVDDGTRQLRKKILQACIAPGLQGKDRVTTQGKDDSSLLCRLASTLSEQNNVRSHNSQSGGVGPQMWSHGDGGGRCFAKPTHTSSSPGEKHGSNVTSTIRACDIAPSTLSHIDFTEYEQDILRYQKQLEVKLMPHAQYMKHQRELDWTTRAMLVGWIVKVHQCFELRPETLFLAVNYIDRFLTCRAVCRDRLQLLGAAAVIIAVKYEEGEPIPLSTIDTITFKRYGIDMIKRAERMILSSLRFELGWPGPMAFLRRTLLKEGDDDQVGALAQYFLEVSLLDERFISDLPSRTAAVTHLLARTILANEALVSTQVTEISHLTVPDRLPLTVS